MATGMVLVIVTRNIDLSVGSIARLRRHDHGRRAGRFLPQLLGFDNPVDLDHHAGRRPGRSARLIGALPGLHHRLSGVPSFIVTLGGLLVWRGAAWWVTSGQTVAPMDSHFQLMGGGAEGSIGATWSWVVGVRRLRRRHRLLLIGRAGSASASAFPLRPSGPKYFLGGVACALILGAVWIANAYPWPVGIARALCRSEQHRRAGRRAVHRRTASPFRC